MDAYIIVVLLLALWLLLMLNSGSIRITTDDDNDPHGNQYEFQGNCSQTQFGCCPDGVNSKMNFKGTNCPRYNTNQGYQRSLY
jgi:hypothetical protein